MKTVVLLNPKGGCGKTTIATNLCGFFAARGLKTALMDFDPQGSSLSWIKLRQQHDAPPIQGIDAAHQAQGVTRAWQLRTEPGTDVVVVDTPAAFDRNDLLNFVARANILLVPVMPSHMDIHAAARFIQDLLLVAKVRSLNKPVALIVNRARAHTRILHSLERFLEKLDLPLITRLRDAQNYVQAAENGQCLLDLPPRLSRRDTETWLPIMQWLVDCGIPLPHAAPARMHLETHPPVSRIQSKPVWNIRCNTA